MPKVTLNELWDLTLKQSMVLSGQYEALLMQTQALMRNAASESLEAYPDSVTDYFETKLAGASLYKAFSIPSIEFMDMSREVIVSFNEFKELNKGKFNNSFDVEFQRWVTLKQVLNDCELSAIDATYNFASPDSQIVTFTDKRFSEKNFSARVVFNQQGNEAIIKYSANFSFCPTQHFEMETTESAVENQIPLVLIKYLSDSNSKATPSFDEIQNNNDSRLALSKCLLMANINNTYLLGDSVHESDHTIANKFYNNINSIRIINAATKMSNQSINDQPLKKVEPRQVQALNDFIDKCCGDNYYHFESYNFLSSQMIKLDDVERLQYLYLIVTELSDEALENPQLQSQLSLDKESLVELKQSFLLSADIENMLIHHIVMPDVPEDMPEFELQHLNSL
tara:strand:+ start:66314 stop:67501 length:1188 start_codon:yes stop_codon:yes gene_type:complete